MAGDARPWFGKLVAGAAALVALVAAKSCFVAAHHVDDIGGRFARQAERSAAVGDDQLRGLKTGAVRSVHEADRVASTMEQGTGNEATEGATSPAIPRLVKKAGELASDVGQDVIENEVKSSLDDEDAKNSP